MAVVAADFPRSQRLAKSERMRIRVRNTGDKAIPTVAITVATRPGAAGGAPVSFGADIADTEVAAASRPIWIMDRQPKGSQTAVTNTWALGRLGPGKTKEFVWRLTPVQAGSFTVDYRVSPSLTGKATATGGRTKGSFRVDVSDVPPAARVGDGGEVVELPGAAE